MFQKKREKLRKGFAGHHAAAPLPTWKRPSPQMDLPLLARICRRLDVFVVARTNLLPLHKFATTDSHRPASA
jgi:hypothetical protein